MKHKTQEQPKPNMAKTHHYNCAYVKLVAVLIMFRIILQRVINIIMLSIGGQRGGVLDLRCTLQILINM